MASYWGEVEIIQNWQSIEGNYSNVTANYYACADSYAGWSNYTTYPFLGLYHGADKTEESQTLVSFDFRKSKRILIGSITKNIPHNTDGTMSVSASFTWDSDHSMVGTLTGYASKTLSTIPRASSISATDANIGSASTININRASSSFTHTVEYSFSGLTGTIANKTSQTSIGWSVPTSFFEKIPNAQSGTVTITCYTYSGDAHVGTTTTTMTISVPTSGTYNSMPVIDSAKAVDTNSKTLNLTGNSSRIVTYFSNVKVNATGRCLNYGTFNILKSNNISMNNKTTSSNGVTTVTGELTHNSNTSTSFNVFLGDVRGLWVQKVLNEVNGDFTVVPYIPLTMSVNAERISPTSNSIKLNFSGNIYNGYYDEAKSNFNDLTIKWRYKLRDSGSWITDGADDTTNGWHNLTLNTDFKYNQNENTYSSIDDVIIEDLFDYQENYTIEILYQDRLSSYTTPQPILAGVPNHDYGKDANGKNYFNVNGNIYCDNKNIFDLVYPIGSIYLTLEDINPSTKFGGTWEKISQGRCLIGAGGSIDENTSNWAGELNNDSYYFFPGERAGQFKHKLTENEMPLHNHEGLYYSGNDKNITLNAGGTNYNLSWGNSGSTYNEVYTGNRGGGYLHNIMQPYLAVNIWQRTA